MTKKSGEKLNTGHPKK